MNDTESLVFSSYLAGQVLCYFPSQIIWSSSSFQSKTGVYSHVCLPWYKMKSMYLVYFSYVVGWPHLEAEPPPVTHSLSPAVRGENQRGKSEITQDKESLIGETKLQAEANQNKVLSLFLIKRQRFSHFTEVKSTSCFTIPGEDKCCSPKESSFLLLLLSFYWGAHGCMVWSISLVVSLGQLSWLCSLPVSSTPPACLSARAEWEEEKEKSPQNPLNAVQAVLSDSQDTGVLPTLF